MTGKHARDNRCPICGGAMKRGLATIPFVLRDGVIIVKSVPAEICQSCHEPFVIGEIVDELTVLLNRVRQTNAEVSVLTYEPAHTAVPVLAEAPAEYKLRSADANEIQDEA